MPFTGLLIASLLAAPPAKDGAETVLRNHCMLWAADPHNPWALAHGIHALGASFLAADGRRAADVAFQDFLQRDGLPDGGPGSGSPFRFPRYGADGTPIEPHANLITRALVCDARLPLSQSFKTSWGTTSLKAMVDGIKRGFRYTPDSIDSWRDQGWTLDLFATVMKPGDKWTTGDGTVISIDRVFDDALAELERETAELRDGMERHLPQVPKRKQGIYAHSCGGLHFVQGVFAWAKHPSVRKRWGKRLDTQVAIVFYRLLSEAQQYDAAYQQTLTTMPQYRLDILVQKLKFYGHWLETVGRIKRELKWKLDFQQTQQVAFARAMLDDTVRQLEAEKAFERMEELRRSKPQLYLDLIGDSCHAAGGLAAWR